MIFSLLALFTGVIAVASLAERSRLGQHLSGAVIVILITMALSNIGAIPSQSPFYDLIWNYFVPLAIALYLVKADLRKIVTEGGQTLVAFCVGVVGAVGGAILGLTVFNLGENQAELGAVFLATYTGGSLNFAAVAQSIGFDNSSQLAAALAIDNILGVVFILGLSFLAGRQFTQRKATTVSNDQPHTKNESTQQELSITEISLTLCIAATLCALGEVAAQLSGFKSYNILFVTVFAVLFATFARRFSQKVRGEKVIATLFIYYFFGVIGAGADLASIFAAPISIFGLVLSIFAVHILVMFLLVRLFNIGVAEAIIASAACITGPPIAASLAILFGWKDLVLPGILTGVLGYVVGSFLGVAMFEFYQ